MAGDDRVRHCAQCNLDVYNFSEMTCGEITRLVAASKGQRLCGRLYRREDGTVLTRNCPVGLRARIRRVSRRVGTALSAAMSVSLAAAQTLQHAPPSLVQIEQSETGIHLIVFDENHALIQRARVVVMSHDGTSVAEGTTDAIGQIRFPALAPDTYEVSISALGFANFRKAVAVRPRQMLDVEITMQVAGALMGEVVMAELETEPSSLANYLIPEPVSARDQPQEPLAVPKPSAVPRRNPLSKFLRALGHVLNP
jgi:hypothetical protein